jgi:hypothetical protein
LTVDFLRPLHPPANDTPILWNKKKCGAINQVAKGIRKSIQMSLIDATNVARIRKSIQVR